MNVLASLRAGIIPMRRLARSLGVDIQRRQPVVTDFLRAHRVGRVLDVGANVGQYARRLRAWGYRGRIISFEPLLSAFEALHRAAAQDPLWDVREFALGDADGTATINVSQESVFSSILTARPELRSAFHSAQSVGTQEIRIQRLDTVIDQLPSGSGTTFLKIDTQGYERAVLSGAARTLDSIEGVQLEVSLTPLYDGEATLPEMAERMTRYGFEIVLIEPVAYAPASQALLQIDCVFARRRGIDVAKNMRGV